jgi:hypothetical protein
MSSTTNNHGASVAAVATVQVPPESSHDDVVSVWGRRPAIGRRSVGRDGVR